MSDFDPKAVEAARQELYRLPGVRMVGPGLRWRDGVITSEPALSVYVAERVEPHEFAASRIPREIAGMPTDVIQCDEPVPYDEEADLIPGLDPAKGGVALFDVAEHPQIRGGIRCEGWCMHEGTITCIARAKDSANDGKIVILSNYHVLMPRGNAGNSVYQPTSTCCGCGGRKIAAGLRGMKTTNKKDYFASNDMSIDAAIALLVPDTECLAEIQMGKIDDNTRQPVVISDVMPTSQIREGNFVRMRGSRSGPRTGQISNTDLDLPADDVTKNFAFRHQMAIAPPIPPGTTTGMFRFSAPGDSGAPILDLNDGKLVALFHTGLRVLPQKNNANLRTIIGIATDINYVISRLTIAIEKASALGQVIRVPKTNVLPGTAPAPSPALLPQATSRMLDQARQQIEATPFGRAYADVVREHQGEVRTLIRRNRRVGAIWQRYGGQALLQTLIDAIARPDIPIPATVRALPLASCASRIAAILQRYGSAALGRDVAVYERMFQKLPGFTYNELLARLRAGEPVFG